MAQASKPIGGDTETSWAVSEVQKLHQEVTTKKRPFLQQMIKKAKEDGMIFYGLGVNMQGVRQYGIEDSMDICDSKWIWEANDCYEIDDNNMDREKIVHNL